MESEDIDLESSTALFDEELNNDFLSFDSFSVVPQENKIVFHYSFCDAEKFAPELRIDLSKINGNNNQSEESDVEGRLALKKRSLDLAAFNMGMVYLSWFYMRFYCPKIVIRAGRLNEEQLAFWKNLYIKALGEFYFVNGIDWRQGSNLVCEYDDDDDDEFHTCNDADRNPGKYHLHYTVERLIINLQNK